MKKFNRVFTVIVFVILYAPIVLLIAASFNSGKDISEFSGFTLSQYSELFKDERLLGLFTNSIIVAVLSALLATVIGTVAAIGINNMGKTGRKVIMSITNIPMTSPEIVTGVALALLFTFVGRSILNTGAVLGFWTLLIAHITFNLPYVILSVMPKLRQLNPCLNEAALDLGCTPVQSFFKVLLPEITPGIITGAMMAFTMSLDDFVISYFVYGPSFSTLPIEIYSYTKKPIPSKVYALFTVMFAVVLVIMIAMNVLQARDENKQKKASLSKT